MESIWQGTVEIPERKKAEGLLEREIIVIGAGMTGILTAYHLQRRGRQVAVLEAGKIAGGQTGRTTAKITSQHGLFYHRLMGNIGFEQAGLYAKANQEAIDAYQRIVAEHGIDCDFQRLPSYLYSTENEEMLKQEAEAAAALGIKADMASVKELPFPTKGAVRFDNQAQFHPLKFIRGIAEELEIYENTPVRKVRGNSIYFDGGEAVAQKIIFATHYPIVNFPGIYFTRQHQERSYVLALAGCGRLEGMYFSADPEGLSFRSAGDILLLGGNSHRTGKNTRGGAYAKLGETARRYYAGSQEVCRWSAQDCMPHDDIPFVGRYSYFTGKGKNDKASESSGETVHGVRDWYVATGYKKWGMSSAMAASLLLADLVTGKENAYEKVFTPQRLHIKAAAGNFAIDMAESVKGLSKGWLLPWKKKEGTGEKRWARCSHLGCRMEWNPDEDSWDCPCHGSRFDGDGNLLDEPAKEPLQCRDSGR